ncbi:MAG: DUF3352 domain-containing protein [Actinomycetota bacterium]
MTRRPAVVLSALAAALVVAVALVAALGAGDADAGAEARAKGAALVPADAVAYASVSMSRDGAQWQALEGLAARVPGGDAKLADLDAMLAADGEGAVMRALGGDISVGLLGVDLAGGLEPAADAVLVATEADGAALLRELARLGFAEGPAIDGTPVWEQGASAIAVDGSLVVGATSRATLREALEVRAGQAPSLADEAAFRATVERLPDDPLALAYLSPARLAPLAQAAAALMPAQESGDLPNAQAQITDLVAALGDVRGLGIAVRAEAGGLRVAAAGDADEAALAARGAAAPAAFAPTLTGRVPADAAGALVFADLGPRLAAALEQLEAASPQLAGYVASIEAATGVSLREGLVPALTGQHALVALDGADPQGALLLAPPDPGTAGATIGRLVGALDAAGLRDGKAGAIAATRQEGGSVIAIGNAPGLAAPPERALADDAGFRATRDAAGVPGQVTGLAWLNADAVRRMAAEQAAERGEQLPAALDAVGGVIAWGEPGGAGAYIAIR